MKSASGVALAVRYTFISKLTEDPKSVHDRMITLRLPLNDNGHCTIIAVYTPSMTNSQETIAQIHHQLDSISKKVQYMKKTK